MSTNLNSRESKLERAQEAFENYDFGVFNIEDQEGWDTSNPLDYIRVAYAVSREDEMCSYKVSFHVCFNQLGDIVEAYGLECRTGGYIGHDPIVRVKIGPEERVHEIDMRSLSRDSGFVVITAEINGSTEYLITTDVSEAVACINGVGGKIVDVTTNFEEVISRRPVHQHGSRVMDGATMMTYGPANRLYLAAVKALAAVNGGLGELPDAELEELKGAIEQCETAIKDRAIYAAEIEGAREAYCSDEIEIDDDPVTSASDEGVWMPHKVSSD